MPALDWNDLQYVLAVARDGAYAAAGRRLNADATTVARRLRAIESALNAKLFERATDGQMRPTEAGEVVIERAGIVEAQLGGLGEIVERVNAAVSGCVRVTAVPVLVNRVFVPALPTLLAQFPDLRIELIADAHDVNLSRRDADIAVRLARPGTAVGNRVFARRIGTLRYAVYASVSRRQEALQLPWVTYEEAMSTLPQAQWIDETAPCCGGFAAVAVNDAESVLQCVQSGLGKSLLPVVVADRTAGIVRVDSGGRVLPEREIWTLTHPDVRHLARVSAVLAWIEATLDCGK
ncbi:LysR family transcriptional regulator (plasmid) [Paraburkholderia sprentiae WSM5005]|uniref:LysR family transcriptional regulator n=1 Tax=Paraburkholderia sprentiae WSM5005 TaxID=754502 RepID=A0A8F4QKU6_9BURK|nr:LysR family transcriptional regulator [Paraburkholderia sprentiae]QXE07353.1 LysR family transcriptional regulator [Paraburkholderia sprentiae WSM5005]